MSDYEKGYKSRQEAARAARANSYQRELFKIRCKAEQKQRESYGDYLFAREPDDTKFPPEYWQREGASTSEASRINLFQLIGDGDCSSDVYYWESDL